MAESEEGVAQETSARRFLVNQPKHLAISRAITLRPYHGAQERIDATLRLPCEMRKTTFRNSSNGMWPGRHRDHPWERRPHRSIQDPGLVSDSLVATWLPPRRRGFYALLSVGGLSLHRQRRRFKLDLVSQSTVLDSLLRYNTTCKAAVTKRATGCFGRHSHSDRQ